MDIFHLTGTKPHKTNCSVGLFEVHVFLSMHEHTVTLQSGDQNIISYVDSIRPNGHQGWWLRCQAMYKCKAANGLCPEENAKNYFYIALLESRK